MSTVALPRWVVGLLVGACAVCLVAVAFLIGRVTAPGAPAGTASIAATGVAAERSTPAGVPDSGVPPSEAPDAGVVTGQGLTAAPMAAASPAAASAGAVPPVGGAPEAAAVAEYFRQMDAVGAEAKAGQDPQALARTVLEQGMSGNMDGLDSLLAGQRALELRLKQIQPPPTCREHHQRSVRLFGRATALLERTRGVMTGQGAADLGGMAGEGREIEVEARALDALANDLRRAAGLGPVS